MISKSEKNIITKEEYQDLLNYQKIHKYFLDTLDSIEIKCLEITQEKDRNNELYLGGVTSDILSGDENSLIDGLKLLNIEIEQDKIVHNKKETNKVGQKKKKFKSGEWMKLMKNKNIDVHKEIVDSPELHDYGSEFRDEDGNSIIRIGGLSKEELDEIMNIRIDDSGTMG